MSLRKWDTCKVHKGLGVEAEWGSPQGDFAVVLTTAS